MKKALLLLGCLLVSSIYLSAQEKKIAFTEFDLDNGLHVILHQDNSTPIVNISVLYHVGSKNEDPKRTGFAHFFEHLMFEGTPHIKRSQYSKMIEEIGGTLNAFTSFDQTMYFQTVPSNYLERVLWMEADRMLDARVDRIGVETQREVVKEERRSNYENRAYGSMREEIHKRAFKEHPYRWIPIGSAQYIDQAQLNEFKDFYETFYVPQNATLCIAGDIDPKKAKEWVQKYFTDIPRGEKPIARPTAVEPPLDGEVRDVVKDPYIQLPAVILAYRSLERSHEDYYALAMLNKLLSEGASSRLSKNLVDIQQKAVFVGSNMNETEDPGLFFMYAIAAGGITPEDLETAINDQIERLKKGSMGEWEFEKLQNQVETEFINSKASLFGIARALSEYHMIFGEADRINTDLQNYLKVSREDLQRVAQTYLTDENRIMLYFVKP